MTIELVNQPTGNSCGPTCLFMIKMKQNTNELISIDDISEMCGTDWIVGTPPDRLEKGLRALNIQYIEYKTHYRPYEKLIDLINVGNIGLLRTITKNIPHWIIVDDFNVVNEKPIFHIVDPWLGYLNYDMEGLEEIWKPREYQFFEILM